MHQDQLRTDSLEAAALTAARADVDVRELEGSEECASASALLARIWGTSIESSPLAGDAMTSIVHAGGSVTGAFDEGALVGVAVGLAGSPNTTQLYSMITGVIAGSAGRGVGLALKFRQRAWAVERGATSMVWTFDPLIRRNAHFNINRLGARAEEYLEDFYPPMYDSVNRADLTDRLVAVWDLRVVRDPRTHIAALGRRSQESADPKDLDIPNGDKYFVDTPPDIEAIRKEDLACAGRWRLRMREQITNAIERGYRITGFTTDGSYVMERTGNV